MKDYVVSLISDDSVFFCVSCDKVVVGSHRIYFSYCDRLVCAIDSTVFTYEEV